MDTQHPYPRPDEVYAASTRLSELLMPRNPDKPFDENVRLAELRLADGNSIVVGSYAFAGYIDDKNMRAVSFSLASAGGKFAHFDRLLKEPLQKAGYDFVNVGAKPAKGSAYGTYGPFYDCNILIEVLEFLEEKKILPQLGQVFSGAVSPLSIGGRLRSNFGNAAPTSAVDRIVAPVELIPAAMIG